MYRKQVIIPKAILVALLLLLAIGMTACGGGSTAVSGTAKQGKNNKLKIEASFYAIGEFAKAIGGDRVEVGTVVSNGTEPHDFEPKAKDIEKIGEADLFVYNGLGMESWVDKVLASVINNGSRLVVIDSSKGAQLIKTSEEAGSLEQGVATSKGVASNGHGQYDPHLWLSLIGAKTQAENIMTALVAKDPSGKSYYQTNFKQFSKRLDLLYKEYKPKFNSLTNKNFVTGHAAFAYLCRDFGLSQNSVENVFAEGEPSAKRLGELVDYCIRHKIRTIFVEELASPKISETLARELNGAKVVKIHTAEAQEDNLDYMQTMEYNLKMIYESMK